MPSWLSLLDLTVLNFCILVALVALTAQTYPYRSRERAYHVAGRWLLLAGGSVLLLHHATQFSPGIRTDFRYLPVALATVLGGPLYGLGVSVPMLLYRFALDGGVSPGGGAWPSVLAALLTVGTSVWATRRHRLFQLEVWTLVRQGGWIVLAGNLAYLFTPGGLWTLLLSWPVKTLALTLVTLLLGSRFQLLGSVRDYRQMAYTDKLTGLGNRRHFDEDLRPGAVGSPAYLLLLDIDHFKDINDQHGHGFGDQVLSGTAALLREHLRPWDGAYRYGGEEFAVLLRQCSPEQARQVAERIRAQVQQGAPAVVGVPVTVSIGAVALPRRLHPARSLEQADAALYAAKRAGRNRVVWAGEAVTV